MVAAVQTAGRGAWCMVAPVQTGRRFLFVPAPFPDCQMPGVKYVNRLRLRHCNCKLFRHEVCKHRQEIAKAGREIERAIVPAA